MKNKLAKAVLEEIKKNKCSIPDNKILALMIIKEVRGYKGISAREMAKWIDTEDKMRAKKELYAAQHAPVQIGPKDQEKNIQRQIAIEKAKEKESEANKEKPWWKKMFGEGGLTEENVREIVKEEVTKYIKEKKVNPWAVCTASAGREDKKKYERCVQKVKKQNR